jgi:glycosyltransferase involved in cell wall biosynthesis
MKILIITPACNEEKNLPILIKSLINQSLLPFEWIIVDDGSKDNTSNVIQKAAIKYSWIKYLRKEKTTDRSPGKSVMEAFYAGYNYKSSNDWDIIMKLDADLVLPSNYLEHIVNEFTNNSKAGVCGGVCVLENNGIHNIEKQTNLDHVRGAIKAYRRECFQEMGGLIKNMGWDTVDEHHARFNGWDVIVKPKLQVIHQRPTHKEFGYLKAAFRNGQMLYSIRMDFILLIGNCVKILFKSPYVLLALSMFFGYVIALFKRKNYIVSKDLGKFIRRYRYKHFFNRIS